MARVPQIIRSGGVSQVAAQPPKAGQGFQAIAELAAIGADFIRPKAEEVAREEGEKAVYRDESGKLQVDEKSVLSGEMGAIHNSAAYAKYMSQKQIDLQNNFTELHSKYEFDPAGFHEAAKGYVKILREDETIPSVLKEDLIATAEREASRQFNGLYRAQVKRDQNDANVASKTARDMLVDDYISLYAAGDLKGAEEKMAEIESLSQFRQNAPYIDDTPEEAEAFLRGVRGAAKASALTRELTELEGATEISDERRAEIQAVLDDPDIDPKTRQSLYLATQGRLKGIDGRSVAKAMTDSSYESMVVRVESGGKSSAKNPNSTALGPHQFLKGTWAGLVKRYKPDWAKGLSAQQIQALRADHDKSSEMFAHFRRENQQVLARGGAPINPGTEYMAHFFGAGTAVKVLRAAPDTPLSSVVPASVIRANPFLKGMTARDAAVWAGRKMTMKASDMAARAVDVAAIDDPEVRAAAASQLEADIKIRRALEQAAAESYKERLTQGDNVTAQEITEDHDLDTDMQISLLNTLKGMQRDQEAATNTVAALNDPSFTFDRFDSKQRRNVDKVYQSSIEGQDPLSPESLNTAVQLSDRTGFLPQSSFNALRGAIKSKDPAVVAMAMETLGRVVASQPAALDPYGGHAEVEKALAEYKRRAEFATADEAAAAMIEARENPPKNVSDQADDAVKKLTVSDVTDHFDRRIFGSPKFATPIQENAAMADYQNLFRDEFLETGDFDTAQARALDQMGRIYGVSEVTGSQVLMKYPPQNFYPAIRGSHDWMTRQLEADVSNLVFGDEAVAPDSSLSARFVDGASLGHGNNWVPASMIKIVSDPQTRADITAGRPASYQVFYMKDDVLQVVPERYVFDPKKDQDAAKDDFDRARSKQNFQGSARRNFYDNVEKYGRDAALEMIRDEEGNAVPY